jgi:hypothetical protein
MSIGAGTFTVPNKILPGAYMNFVSAARADAALSERGVAAIAMMLPQGTPTGQIIRVTATEFYNNSESIFGVSSSNNQLRPIREVLRNAREVLLYGFSPPPDDEKHADFLSKLESHSFNTVGLVITASEEQKKMYADFTRRMREDVGMKIQCVLYDYTEADYEGVISLNARQSSMVPWVVGAQAGAMPGKSLINAVYNGEGPPNCDFTITELEDMIKEGSFAFIRVGRSVRVLEDINTLTTLSPDKNKDFQDNQTIRLIDQIGTDIAALFNERYLGKTPNDASGRVALWSDIVAHHRQLEQLSAIEDFQPEDVSVEAGNSKKSVVIRDCITPVGAMAQLYMTVIIS